MKKIKLLFMLLMAIVMMAMSPQRLWAVNDDEPDEECPHDGGTFWEPNGDGTHSKMCSICGEGVGPYNEDCADDDNDYYCDKCDALLCKHDGGTYWESSDDGTHAKFCSKCYEYLDEDQDCADDDEDGRCDVCGHAMGGNTSGGDEPGETNYPVLELGESTIDIKSSDKADNEDECTLFIFVATQSGSLTITTSGNEDTSGYLYNSSMELLTYNDDRDEDNNFQIIYEVEADSTYYIGVKNYNGYAIEGYTIKLSIKEPPRNVAILASTGGFEDEGAENLFDNDADTKWCSKNDSECNFYVIFKYDAANTITGYSLVDGDDTGDERERHWKDWTLYGANFSSDNVAKSDTAIWNEVDVRSGHVFGNDMSFEIANTAAYQYYKLVVTDLNPYYYEDESLYYLQQMADINFTFADGGDEPGDEYPALSLNDNTVNCNVYDWQVEVYFSCLFSFTPEENGNYAFTFAGGDAEIFTSFYCNQSAENPLSANTTYYIRLWANEAITDGTLTITYEGSGDEYPALSLYDNTVNCTQPDEEGEIYMSPIYTFTPEEDGNYAFTFEEGDVEIYTSKYCNGYAENPLIANTTYYIRVYAHEEAVSDGTLTITYEGSGDEYPALSLNDNTVNCNAYDEPSGVYISYLYTFTPEENGNYAFTLAGGDVDIFTSFYCDEIAINPLTGGTTYYIRLWANEAITDGTLTITYEGSGDEPGEKEYPVLALGENTGISVSNAGTEAISSEIFIFNTDCDGIYKFEIPESSFDGEAYIYADEEVLNPIGTTEVCLTGPNTYYVRLIGVGEDTTVTLNISRVGAMDRNLYMVAKDDYFGDATSIVFTTHEALPASADSLTNLNDSETVCLYQDSDDETIFYIAPTVEKVAVLAPSDCSALFLSLNKLESIDLSNFDTRNVTSMNDMFHMDTPEWDYEAEAYDESTKSQLRNIIFGEFFTTDSVKIMSDMFSECRSLQALDLSNFNTEKVTSMYDMFSNCRSLQALDLSNFNTENVTNMCFMFQACLSLQSLNLSSFNTDKVEYMVGMFQECSTLRSLGLSNFNTENVTNMSYMFCGCESLHTLDLSNFNTENVTNMSFMFQESNSLQSLDLSSFDTKNVTNMSYMFCFCNSLRSLDLSSFNTENVTDMYDMFSNCSSLQSLDLRNFNTEKVENMESMFQYCNSLRSLDLSSFNTEKVTNMCSMFLQSNSLQSLDLSRFNTEKVENMSCMFFGCNKLQSIFVSSGFVVGEDANTEVMFIDCEQLVGMNGTKYSGDHTDGEYACIDTYETPGYFSTVENYETYALNDGEAYTLRTKANVGTLTYTREIKESQVNKWQALYVPFQMSSDDWSTDYDVAAINNFHEYYDEDGKLSDRVLEIVKIKSGKTKANYPYLIRPKSAGTKTITLTDVELASAKENSISCSSTKTKYTFTGSYQTVENLAANGYVFLTGGALCTTSNAATTLKPQRWFLDVENYDTQWDAYTPAASDPADPTMQSSGIRIQVIGEEEATGIEEIQVKTTFGHNAAGNGAIYDIAGRRLNEATRGFNIVRSQDKVQKLFVK